jgi:hypothetical protein
MERRSEAAVAEDDSSDIDWYSDDPNEPTPEERAAGQRVLVDSFEALKKAEDVANEALLQRLIEDSAAHRALAAARRAAKKQRRVGRNDGFRPSDHK